MKKVKYTFIIPVYNSQETIIGCLDSICNDIISTFKKLSLVEILVVENGSIDDTEEKVNNYIKNTSCNIKLIYSDKGVSKARNAGIVASNGEWVIFVDADDLWLQGSLKQIDVNCKEKNADLFMYSFIKGKLSEAEQDCFKIIHKRQVGESLSNDIEKIRAWMISKPTLRMQVWSKVFKSSLLKKNKIFFNEQLRYSEDSEFVIRYSKICKSIDISSYCIYKYVISEGSVMRSVDNKRIDEYMKSMSCSKEYMINESKLIKKAFHQYVLSHLNIILVHDVFVSRKGKKFKVDCSRMKELIKNDIFKESLDCISLRDCLSIQLLPELFLKLHLYFMVAFMCYTKSYVNQRKERS